MKKYLFLILLLIVCSYRLDVNAFSRSYDYNYEVQGLKKDSNGNISINGWGILNAGVCDSSNNYCNSYCDGSKDVSPCLEGREGWGSGNLAGKCTGSENNKYLYSLYIIPIQDDLKTYDINKKEKVGQTYGSGTSLTEIMCRKKNNKCDAIRSSCYENVGWTFTFNESVFEKATYKNGYIFYLEIYSTGANKTVGFPITIYESKIDSSMGTSYNYTSGFMEVRVIAFSGYYRNCGEGGCYKKNENQFRNGKSYNVLGVHTDGQTYFKIGNRLYIPSSWVAPPKSNYVIFLRNPVAVDVCLETTTPQPASNQKIKACSGTKTFEATNETTCTGTNYTYYKKTCVETDNKVNLSVNGINGQSFKINNGGGFSVDGDISTNLKCTYTFDYLKFEENYNNVLYNLSILTNGSEDYYANLRLKQELDNILNSYIDLTSNTTSWNSNYDFSKLVANMTVNYNSGVWKTITLLEDEVLRKTIDLNGDGIPENNYCSVLETKTLNGKNVNTNISCGESHQMKLKLPKTCLSVGTGEVVDCSLVNVIDGGNKFYLDLNESGGSIILEVTNLGYDGNWRVELDTCSFTTNGLLKEKIKFRQIDLNDPFLENYNSINYKRGIGTNFKNNTYDFVNIIASDIWEKNYLYAFDMSKVNIEKIRRNTSKDVSKYLGSDCTLVGNYYRCAFIRDNNYFTNIYNLNN